MTQFHEGILKVPAIFPDRKARTEAKKHLAEALNTTIQGVNRLKLCNKPLESVKNREKKAKKAAKHREKCRVFAEKVVKGFVTRKKAAIACEISERQMARYIAIARKKEQE